MNYKKILLSISIINVFAWGMLEFYSKKYAGSNVEIGAGFLVFFQLLAYYAVTIASYSPKKIEEPEISPQNCKEHDWQKHKYLGSCEICVKCGAERGV